MKIIKRILIALLVLVVLFIGAAIAVPIIFKDKIVATAKEEINKSVRAKVDFATVDLSLIKGFPNLVFSLKDFSVTGIETFEGINLVKAKSIDFKLDLMSVISSSRPIEIISVNLIEPDINVMVLDNGQANYDITFPTDERIEETASETDYSKLRIQLEKYLVKDGQFVFDDRSMGVFVSAKNINHSGSGNFTIDNYDLNTTTNIDQLTVQYGDISYLKNAVTSLDAILNIDQANSKYTLKDNELRLNQLVLNAEGFVQLAENEDINMDLAFSSPQNDFKQLLSMVPNAYIEGYENVKVAGKFDFNGTAKGTFNSEKEVLPAFMVNFSIDNGNIQYPDLPLGIANINTDIKINSPSSNLNDLKVDANRFNLKIGNNPIAGRFSLRTPISDPAVDSEVKGVLNLEEFSKAFPIEGIEQLSGIITADVKVNTRLSAIDAGAYDQVDMKGNMQIDQMTYKSSDLPTVFIKTMDVNFTPQNVQIKDFQSKLGQSDIKAQGYIDNILAYFSPKKTMTGKMRVQSDFFDANEWMSEEEAMPVPSEEEGAEEVAYDIFDRFSFDLEGAFREIAYDVYTLKNTVVRGQIGPQKLQADQLETRIGASDFAATGTILNIFDYLFDNGVLKGDIEMTSQLIDLNEFMETVSGEAEAKPTASEEAPLEVVPVPERMDIDIDANIGRVKYSNIELKDVRGKLLVADQAVILDNASSRTLGGKMNISGSYDTKNIEAPLFSFKYDLQQLDFAETFNTINTFQALAPIGKFIKGNFNSTMIMEGELGKDLMPKLQSLNIQGFLQTIQGIVGGFKPLQIVGNALNIEALTKEIDLGGTKNWFEVKDGTVEIKEFDWKVDDIALKIGGQHSLNQEMAYSIKAKVPRKLLEKGAIGKAVDSGYGLLQGQAAKLGVNLEKSEFVNVLINLTGSTTDPKIKLNLLSGDGETTLVDAGKAALQDEINTQKEALEQKAEEKLEEGKAIAKEKVDQVVDTTKKVINSKLEEAKTEAKEKAEEILKEKLGSQAGKLVDSTANKVLGNTNTQEKVDSIKSQLDKFNPFKKKKKN
ncbi:MAG: AsmA-like C-terminal region-containing protein [Saprospiraceae bacterium]